MALNNQTKHSFTQTLNDHEALTRRRNEAEEKISLLRQLVQNNPRLTSQNSLNVFAAGSLGRRDVGTKSDLDVFFSSSSDVTHLEEIKVLAELIFVGRQAQFEEFSNDGQYLKIFSLQKCEPMIGSPTDDQENWFTARMLLLLESAALSSEPIWKDHIKKVLNVYFRDATDHTPFKPVFFLNDLKRFWATLCLNYETARHRSNPTDSTKKPWRKKNFNLKFSRMLSVYSMIIPLLLKDDPKLSWVLDLCTMNPLQRLAFGLDELGDDSLIEAFSKALDSYEAFLSAKEMHDLENPAEAVKKDLQDHAEMFHRFFLTVLQHRKIPAEMFGFLLI
jgi:hypothetical protein